MAAAQETFKLTAWFVGKDEMSHVAKKVGVGLQTLKKDAAATLGLINSYSMVSAVMLRAGRSILRFTSSAMQAFAKFESEILFTAKVMNKGVEAYDSISNAVLRVASNVPIATQKIAEMGSFLSQMGIDQTDHFEAMLGVVSKTALATRVPAKQLSLMFGKLNQIYGLTGKTAEETRKKAERLASSLVAVSNKTADVANRVADMTTRFASSAKLMNVAAHKAMSISSILVNNSVRARMGATQMMNLLKAMMTRPAELASEAGIQIADFQNHMTRAMRGQEDGAIVLLGWLNAMKMQFKDNPQGLILSIQRLFGTGQQMSSVVLKLVENVEQLNKNMRESDKAYKDATQLQEALAIVSYSYAAQLQQLANAWTILKIKMASALKPVLTPLIWVLKTLVNVISMIPKPILGLIGTFTVWAGVAAIVAAKFTLLSMVFGSLQNAMIVAGGAASSFLRIMTRVMTLGMVGGSFVNTKQMANASSTMRRIVGLQTLMQANKMNMLLLDKKANAAKIGALALQNMQHKQQMKALNAQLGIMGRIIMRAKLMWLSFKNSSVLASIKNLGKHLWANLFTMPMIGQKGYFSMMAKPLMDIIAPAKALIVRSFISLGKVLAPHMDKIGQALGKVGTSLVNKFGPKLAVVASVIKKPFELAAKGIMASFDFLWKGIAGSFNFAASLIGRLGFAIFRPLEILFTQGFTAFFSSLGNAVIFVVKDILAYVGGAVYGLISAIVSPILKAVASSMMYIYEVSSKFIIGQAKAIHSFFKTYLNAKVVSEYFSGMFHSAGVSLKIFGEQISWYIQGIGTWISTAWGNMKLSFSVLLGQLKWYVGKIPSALNNLRTRFLNNFSKTSAILQQRIILLFSGMGKGIVKAVDFVTMPFTYGIPIALHSAGKSVEVFVSQMQWRMGKLSAYIANNKTFALWREKARLAFSAVGTYLDKFATMFKNLQHLEYKKFFSGFLKVAGETFVAVGKSAKKAFMFMFKPLLEGIGSVVKYIKSTKIATIIGSGIDFIILKVKALKVWMTSLNFSKMFSGLDFTKAGSFFSSLITGVKTASLAMMKFALPVLLVGGAIAFLYENWESVKASFSGSSEIGKQWSKTWGELKSVFSEVKTVLLSVFSTISSALVDAFGLEKQADDVGNFSQLVIFAIKAIGSVVKTLAQIFIIVMKVVEPVLPIFLYMFTGIANMVLGFIQMINGDFLGGLQRMVQGAWQYFISPFVRIFSFAFNIIAQTLNYITGGALTGFIKGMNKVLKSFASGSFLAIKNWIGGIVGAIKDFGVMIWNAITYPFVAAFEYLTGKWNAFIAWFSGKKVTAKTKSTKDGNFEAAVDVASAAPKLATGGIVTSEILATIGEKGKEAVLPLNEGVFSKLFNLKPMMKGVEKTNALLLRILYMNSLGISRLNEISINTDLLGILYKVYNYLIGRASGLWSWMIGDSKKKAQSGKIADNTGETADAVYGIWSEAEKSTKVLGGVASSIGELGSSIKNWNITPIEERKKALKRKNAFVDPSRELVFSQKLFDALNSVAQDQSDAQEEVVSKIESSFKSIIKTLNEIKSIFVAKDGKKESVLISTLKTSLDSLYTKSLKNKDSLITSFAKASKDLVSVSTSIQGWTETTLTKEYASKKQLTTMIAISALHSDLSEIKSHTGAFSDGFLKFSSTFNNNIIKAFGNLNSTIKSFMEKLIALKKNSISNDEKTQRDKVIGESLLQDQNASVFKQESFLDYGRSYDEKMRSAFVNTSAFVSEFEAKTAMEISNMKVKAYEVATSIGNEIMGESSKVIQDVSKSSNNVHTDMTTLIKNQDRTFDRFNVMQDMKTKLINDSSVVKDKMINILNQRTNQSRFVEKIIQSKTTVVSPDVTISTGEAKAIPKIDIISDKIFNVNNEPPKRDDRVLNAIKELTRIIENLSNSDSGTGETQVEIPVVINLDGQTIREVIQRDDLNSLIRQGSPLSFNFSGAG
jgi:TP901 family phage tail tape measure protein